MLYFFFLFLITQVFYQILVVTTVYWADLLSANTIAILRDFLWLMLCLFFFLFHRKALKSYLAQRKNIILWTLGLTLFGIISSFLIGKNLSEILIGIKYGRWYLIILILWGGIWYLLQHQASRQEPISSQKASKTGISFHFLSLQRLKYGLIMIVVLWRIWQTAKLLFPDFFYAIGYGGLDDFHFGVNPPIYYLTWFEGTLRRQGLFSWPNNYAYFLVVFLPVIRELRNIKSIFEKEKRGKEKIISLSVLLLWIITLIATLSRAGIIWAVVALVLINSRILLKNKKRFISGIFAVVGGILGLSFLKSESTRIHIEKKLWGLSSVIQHPIWQWLGSSGPAIHHQGKELPENYYLQIMIDIGALGFLLWCGVMGIFFWEQKKLKTKISEKNLSQHQFSKLLSAFQYGLLALLVMGLFLHAFEDSMVNYLFFVLYGVSIWVLQALMESKNEKEV